MRKARVVEPTESLSDRSNVFYGRQAHFRSKVGRCETRRKTARVDHHRRESRCLGSQAFHYPGEDALVARSLPTVVVRLRRTVARTVIRQSQVKAVKED